MAIILTFLKLWFSVGNLKKVAQFVIKNWQLVLLIILAGAAWWYVDGLKDEIQTWKDKYNQEHLNLIACQTTVDHQNGEIERWANVGIYLNQQFKELEEQLIEERKQTEKRIKDILNRPKPKTCDESIDYLIDRAKERSWDN